MQRQIERLGERVEQSLQAIKSCVKEVAKLRDRANEAVQSAHESAEKANLCAAQALRKKLEADVIAGLIKTAIQKKSS